MTINLRTNPLLYEINAVTFLSSLSEKYGRKLTLATIPGEEWQYLEGKGFDLLWLMGVWQRSPYGRQLALNSVGLCGAYSSLLPGWREEDIAGSPYAIFGYQLDKLLGSGDELGILKARLNNRGIRLLLDFVPNHLAIDHPWTFSHPKWFIRGTRKSVKAHPEWFFLMDDGVYLAHGRDPNFPSWTDTVQVNFFSREMRKTLIAELLNIAEVADGVRCDMAMLALNDIFEKVWGEVVKPRIKPESEFWWDAIATVKARYPDFIFLAEAYWRTEKQLIQLGFDYIYDKTLYDRLKYSKPAEIRDYLVNESRGLGRGVHFIENHDEERAPEVFGREHSLAAAVAIATIPGLKFFHNGQLEGKMCHIPVQMGREAHQPVESNIRDFYDKLINSIRDNIFHNGSWNLLVAEPAWEGSDSFSNLLVWCWTLEKRFKLVVINYSPQVSQGRVKLPLSLDGKNLVISFDELADATYQSQAKEVAKLGLYIELKPWQSHILEIVLS